MQVGRTSFGKPEVQFFLRNSNFEFSEFGFVHPQKTPRKRSSLTGCPMCSVSPTHCKEMHAMSTWRRDAVCRWAEPVLEKLRFNLPKIDVGQLPRLFSFQGRVVCSKASIVRATCYLCRFEVHILYPSLVEVFTSSLFFVQSSVFQKWKRVSISASRKRKVYCTSTLNFEINSGEKHHKIN